MTKNIPFDLLPDNALMRRKAVQAVLPYPTSTFYAKIASGELPKPVKLSARSVAWRVGDIRKVLADLNAQEVANA